MLVLEDQPQRRDKFPAILPHDAPCSNAFLIGFDYAAGFVYTTYAIGGSAYKGVSKPHPVQGLGLT